jgi:hypothetical protein
MPKADINQGELPLIGHLVESVSIDQRANDGYINATAMCRAAGKERGGSGWLDSLFPFLSGASRVADYAAVSRVVRLS